MKIMLCFMVLLASLWLLPGTSFANGDCYDYEYTYTNADTGETNTGCVEICFSAGSFTGFCVDGTGVLVTFFDAVNQQALWYSTNT
jgi:hypothetical protein